MSLNNDLKQRFSTWGMRTGVPLGVCEKLKGGTPNFKNHSKQVYLGRIFELGVGGTQSQAGH